MAMTTINNNADLGCYSFCKKKMHIVPIKVADTMISSHRYTKRRKFKSFADMTRIIDGDFEELDIALMKQISIKYISNVHSDTLRSLTFYSEELFIFQNRLEEISSANSGVEIAIQVEHFQNLFIIHQKQIDKINHRLHENLKFISNEIQVSSGYLDEPLLLENLQLNEQFLEEEKLFREMKVDFYQFAAKWM